MRFLSFLFHQGKPTEVEILNYGLKILLKFDLESGFQIKKKLLSKYSFLTKDKLLIYQEACQKAKTYGNHISYEAMVKREKEFDPITKAELIKHYKSGMENKFPWVDKSNLKAIFNLAEYGLRHDGWQFKKP